MLCMLRQLEIVISFFVGYHDEDGIYIDNLGKVAKTYLGSFWLFWFDAITSIPFSLIDYRVAQATPPSPFVHIGLGVRRCV